MAEGVRRFPAGTVVRYCPVDGCPWTSAPRNVDAVVEVQLLPLSLEGPLHQYPRTLVDAAVRDVLFKEVEEVEREVRDHLESHDVVDFVRTIQRLREDLEAG